jgi:hypothetical protein
MMQIRWAGWRASSAPDFFLSRRSIEGESNTMTKQTRRAHIQCAWGRNGRPSDMSNRETRLSDRARTPGADTEATPSSEPRWSRS